MRTGVVALPADATPDSVAVALNTKPETRHQQRLFPVIDAARRLVGVVTRGDLRGWLADAGAGAGRPLGAAIERQPVVAYADEPLRIIVFRMAETGLTRLPVVSRQDGTLVGMLALTDFSPRGLACSKPSRGASACSARDSGSPQCSAAARVPTHEPFVLNVLFR